MENIPAVKQIMKIGFLLYSYDAIWYKVLGYMSYLILIIMSTPIVSTIQINTFIENNLEYINIL